jgi:hypothetical protein
MPETPSYADPYTPPSNHLSAKNLQPLLNIYERLLARWRNRCTEYQLCAELPVLRNVPCICDLLVDQWVVVLEVGAKSFLLESSPDSVLVHSVGMTGPEWELVGIDRELLLHSGNCGAVDEEEDLGGSYQ